MEDFSKQKIIYPEITKFINFYNDESHFFTNNKCFIVTGKHIAYLTALLNSSLFKYCFLDNFPELLGGTRELRKVFIEKIPVLKVSNEINHAFETILKKIQNANRVNSRDKKLELELDRMIFELYELTDEEKDDIGFIEIQ